MFFLTLNTPVAENLENVDNTKKKMKSLLIFHPEIVTVNTSE